MLAVNAMACRLLHSLLRIVVWVAMVVSAPQVAVAGESMPPPAKPESLTLSKRILLIGDSNTHHGHLVGELARVLENEHGYFGSGYRSVVADVGNGQADVYQPYIKIRNVGEWKSVHFIGGEPSSVISPDGTCLQSADASHAVEVDFVGTGIDVYYAARPKGGKIRIEVDSAPAVEVATDADAVEIRRHRVTGLPLQQHRLKVSPSGDAEVTLCGVESGTTADASKSAVVHKWGRSTAATMHYAKLDPAVWQSALKLINPDYVVVMLGTNDHLNFAIAKPIMLNNLSTIVQRVQAGAPEARVMIVSTVPVGRGLSMSNRLRQRYLESLPDLSRALGCDYWDLAAACGATNEEWFSHGHTTDRIHFNLAGAQAAAPQMLKAIDAVRQTEKPKPEMFVEGERAAGELPKFVNLSLWFAGDGALALDAQGRVAHWSNLTNQEYLPLNRRTPSARAYVPAMRPTWVRDVVNGKPAVRFDGQRTALALPADASSEGFAVVVRARRPTGALLGASLSLYNRYGPGPQGTALLLDPKSKDLKGTFFINGKPTPADQLQLPENEFVILSCEGGAAFAVIGQNDYYQRYTRGPGDPETISHFNGDIAELIAWGKLAPKDAGQRQRVEAYLAAKYAIRLTDPAKGE